jgi:hypothetical protein
MKTAPHCPLDGCTGTFTHKTSKKNRPYRQCDTCGAFDGARFLTADERARQRAEKAAKKAKKTATALREEERQAARQQELEVEQLPVPGWSPGDWFPELKELEGQMRLM